MDYPDSGADHLGGGDGDAGGAAAPAGGRRGPVVFAVLDKGRLQAYALYFIRDGERVPFDGEVSLSVTKPGRMTEPRLYRVSPDGMARDGLLSLSAAYEAPYFVVADEAGPGSAPQTGEANFSGRFAAMGAAALTKRYAVKKMKEEAQWN